MTSGLAVFDTTIQDTNLGLKDIETRLGDCGRQEAYVGLHAVLHALRDRLPAQAAVNFAAQLPLLLRGVYYEGWTLPERSDAARSLTEFADKVKAAFPPRFRFDPVMTCEAIFAAITKFISEGEVAKIKTQLPARFATCGLQKSERFCDTEGSFAF